MPIHVKGLARALGMLQNGYQYDRTCYADWIDAELCELTEC